MSLYGFEIPHAKVQPARDMISVQLPFPPRKIGNILTPDLWRDIAQHGTQAGIIRAMGPLAFQYKDGNGLAKQNAQIGDWVIIKWGAGTMFQASKGIVTQGGWRYLSSFNDVIGVVPANEMPDPETLCWDESETAMDTAAPVAEPEPSKLTDEDIARRLGTLGVNDARADGFSAPNVLRPR